MSERRARQSLDALTGLRFVLALWVVVYHLTGLSSWFGATMQEAPGYVVAFTSAGGSAVGVFFLLSGFVLAYSYGLANPWNGARLQQFLLARFARIYPTYLFGLLLGTAVLLIPFAKGTEHLKDVPKAFVARLAAEVLLLVQSWIPQDYGTLNTPSWSLSVEAFFYLSFPFLGLLLWRLRARAHILLSLTGLWGIMCSLPVLLQAHTAAHAPHSELWIAFVKFNPLVRLPDFVAGILLCRLYFSLKERPYGSLRVGQGGMLAAVGAIAGLAIIVLYPRSAPGLTLHNGLLLPASCALLLGLALGGPVLPKLLSIPVLRFLGEASFALYLIHEPVWILLASMTRSIERAIHTPIPPGIFVGMYLALAITLASLLHLYLERPMRRFILSRWGAASVREKVPALADPM